MTIKNKHKLYLAISVLGSILLANATIAAEVFRHTITGEELKILDEAPPEGRDTEAVKRFLETGQNGYVEVESCLPKGEEVYLVACSGCHGHVAEGKVGPGLNDAYWTYPKNTTDKGLFETIFGGGQGMMGPHGSHLQLDETLKLIAWIRHLYTGDIAAADWLTEEQKKKFKAYAAGPHTTPDEAKVAEAEKNCKVSAN